MAVEPSRVQELLNPTSIAVVGASDKSPWAQGFVNNLVAKGTFAGSVHMVNPTRTEAFGQGCYPAVSDISEPVDHAAILVPASRLMSVLRDCAAAGVHSATVIASGFAEAGPDGVRLSEEVAEFCESAKIALVGPNCYGFNNYLGTYVSRYNVTVPPVQGNIGFSFQSGQLGAATADAAYSRGVRLAYAVSSGNELVVDWNDYQEFFLQSPEIKVLGGVIERIPDPDRFADIARRAMDAGKPIVLLKPGKSAAATRIAVAHTGSVTGSDAIVDAFLKDLGIIRVDSVEELAETAGLLAKKGWPRGPRAVYIGYSGGAAELFAEQADGTSVELHPYSEATHAELARVTSLPPGSIHNPLDMTVDGAVAYDDIVRTLVADDEVDMIVCMGAPMLTSQRDNDQARPFRASREEFLTRTAEEHGKLAVFHDTSDTQPGDTVFLHEPAGGAHYLLGHVGVTALANAAWYGRQRAAGLAAPVDETVDEPAPTSIPALAGGGTLSEVDSKALLRAYGIPVTEDRLATSSAEAGAAGTAIGYPVVMKVVAANVAHKSDVGGVRVGVTGAAEALRAYDEIIADVTGHVPDAQIDGVLVAPLISGGREFLAGVSTDANLGPAVVAGLGGTYVEVFHDVALMTAPVTAQRARAALERLRSFPLLAGTRGERAADIDAYVDVLVRLGRLARDLGDRLVELDINPLFVLDQGRGAIAADALVVLKEAAG